MTLLDWTAQAAHQSASVSLVISSLSPRMTSVEIHISPSQPWESLKTFDILFSFSVSAGGSGNVLGGKEQTGLAPAWTEHLTGKEVNIINMAISVCDLATFPLHLSPNHPPSLSVCLSFSRSRPLSRSFPLSLSLSLCIYLVLFCNVIQVLVEVPDLAF